MRLTNPEVDYKNIISYGCNYSKATLSSVNEMLCKLKEYEELGSVKCYKDSYEWLLSLNDDELSYQAITRNDVQNALIELLGLVNDIIAIQDNIKQ